MESKKTIKNAKENTMKIFGYEIERVMVAGTGSHKIAYLLHGPRVTYKLAWSDSGKTLYAINSKGNICGIKGNYNFTVKEGRLAVIN